MDYLCRSSSAISCPLHINLSDFPSGKAYSYQNGMCTIRQPQISQQSREAAPTRQVMKIHIAIAGMLCFAALTTSACVMSSTYNEAVADLDATKAEIDSTRTQSKVLTEQVNELQQLKIDLAKQKEEISLAVHQAQDSMQAEHVASLARLNRLNRAISQLNAQQRRLLYALQRANEERPELQSMVEGYKSKLGEVDGSNGSRGSLSPPPIAPTNEQGGTALAPPSQVAGQPSPVPNPTVTTPAAPTDPTAVNPKPHPANKQTSDPVEDDWLSMIKGWVIAFWHSIFS
jgi:hypothetical protein